MKIVVIGGSGLIGSKLVEKLREAGHDAARGVARLGRRHADRRGTGRSARGRPRSSSTCRTRRLGSDAAVLEFFQTSTRNILAAEATAGVSHHVALSVVGTDRLPDSGYFRAKLAQEEAIKAATVPVHDRPRDAVLRVHRPHRRFEHRRRDGSCTAGAGSARGSRRRRRRVGGRGGGRAGERHRRAGRPRTVPSRRAHPPRAERERRRTPGDGRPPRALLRRRARRPLPHPRRRRIASLRPASRTGSAKPWSGRRRPRRPEPEGGSA